MQVKIIGGGAAGFFTAVNIKALRPDIKVTILERTRYVLSKVAISGGGRCNLTNTFNGIGDLSEAYPRGHRLMRKIFHSFGPKEVKEWFEDHGVKLVIQPDQCIFPATQDAQTIIDCLRGEARRLGVELQQNVTDIDIDKLLNDGDKVVVCTGGAPNISMLSWLKLTPDEIVKPVPSLFTIAINDANLNNLMGTVAENATLSLAGTKHKASGALLITHWGVSGPATLRLSSYAARTLNENGYTGTLLINWQSKSEEETAAELKRMSTANPQKKILNTHPEDIPTRLWEHIVGQTLGDSAEKRWCEIGKKEMNKLIQNMTATPYPIAGRAPFKDEFVTAGGVCLNSLNSNTLESKRRPGLYFAGEVIDVDGITGGFNFTAAWSTGMTVARAIAKIE